MPPRPLLKPMPVPRLSRGSLPRPSSAGAGWRSSSLAFAPSGRPSRPEQVAKRGRSSSLPTLDRLLKRAGCRAGAALAEAGAALEAAETTRAATGPALAAAARTASTPARRTTSHAKLAAEARALAEVLAVKDGERWPPMVYALAVPDGLETALGAALGEELTSAADREDGTRHWRELPAFDPVPGAA